MELSVIAQDGFRLDVMRNALVKTGLDNGQDYLLFLDTDMSFPRNTIRLMLEDFEANEDLEAITGLYTWKKPPYVPHVYSKYNQKTKKFQIAGQFPMNKLLRVEGAGTGCLMVKKEVFQRTTPPWFAFESDNDRVVEKMTMGEDLYFCVKAKPKMALDPRIRCVHYANVGFSILDYLHWNGAKQKKDGNFDLTAKQIKAIGIEQSKNLSSGKG